MQCLRYLHDGVGRFMASSLSFLLCIGYALCRVNENVVDIPSPVATDADFACSFIPLTFALHSPKASQACSEALRVNGSLV